MYKLGYIVWVILCSILLSVGAEDIEEFTLKGEYEKALKLAADEDENLFARIEIYKITGRYKEALEVWRKAASVTSEISVLYEGIELFRLNNMKKESSSLQIRVKQLTDNSFNIWRPIHLVISGRLKLLHGADAADILKNFYDKAILQNSELKEAYIASAELAFTKEDMETAGNILQRANKKIPDDPDILLGLAKAFKSSDPDFTNEIFKKIAEINPRHTATFKFKLKEALLSEKEELAEALFKELDSINVNDPHVLAYKACFHLLKNEPEEAKKKRAAAFEVYDGNPLVDYTIGSFLSYRGKFSQANEYYKRVMQTNENYQSAKVDYCLNLLRLGKTEEGFKLAAEISEKDPYNLTAFNLTELSKVFKELYLVKNKHFSIRMSKRDALIYGDLTEKFLLDAREKLTKKYGFDLKDHVYVDFYDDAEDFAIRNFSYPLEFGALGICFGNVVTMKTIEAQHKVHNWKETLWHEFTHVITLGASKKNIPRWLTEGISVYEESLGPEGWGMKMNLQFRQRLAEGKLIPIDKLNAGFHSEDIMFAYFQSGMLVEYLIEKHGFDRLKKHIKELASGGKPLELLAKSYGSLLTLDVSFAKYAAKRAAAVAPKADFAAFPEGFNPRNQGDVESILKKIPNHFPSLGILGPLVEVKDPARAESIYRKMLDLFPGFADEGNAYERLVNMYKSQGDEEKEKEILIRYCQVNANSPAMYVRMIEIFKKAGDMEKVKDYSERLIGVNPVMSLPYTSLAEYFESTKKPDEALAYYSKALMCHELTNKPSIHFSMAKLLKNKDKKKAKRYLLMCLEEAPRFRDAYKLLKELTQ